VNNNEDASLLAVIVGGLIIAFSLMVTEPDLPVEETPVTVPPAPKKPEAPPAVESHDVQTEPTTDTASDGSNGCVNRGRSRSGPFRRQLERRH